MNALHIFVKMKDGFAAVIIFVLSHLLFNSMSLLVVFLTTSQRLLYGYSAGAWFVHRFSTGLCAFWLHDAWFFTFLNFRCMFFFKLLKSITAFYHRGRKNILLNVKMTQYIPHSKPAELELNS